MLQPHHHHHQQECSRERMHSKAFIIGITLNMLFVLAEGGAGLIYNSMGLLADAGHNFGDVSGLLLSFGAYLLATRAAAHRFSYGFGKGTILAAFLNSLILIGAVAVIIIECIEKFRNPAPVSGWSVVITAGIGILINGATMLLFARDQERDLNIKGAYLHMLADTLVSVGVVLSGVIMLCTGWHIIDPIIGLIIAAVILWASRNIFAETFRLMLDAVPAGIDIDEIAEHLLEVENVESIHHIHIWAISTTANAVTLHVVLRDISKMDDTRVALRKELAEHGLKHATIEFETANTPCPYSCEF